MGKKETYKGVRIGFAKGYLLSDEMGYLEKGNRKQVYWRDIERLEESDIELLKSYLFETAMLDEQENIKK